MNICFCSRCVFSSVGRFFSAVAVAVIVLGFVFGGVWCNCVGLPAGDSARETLESAGYEDIELGTPHRYQCGKSDEFSNSFTATNPRGKRVEGIVCCGWSAGCVGKACTIRH